MLLPPLLFQKNRCPICGVALISSNHTKEHIFPQWMLKTYKLYNEHLILLNGTDIPYRSITVPFCKKCNGIRFSTLENTVKTIFQRGKIKKTEEYHVVIWLIKIYLGIRNLEQRLPLDRAKTYDGNILPENFFEDQNQIMYSLLQTYHPATVFKGNFPWSFFWYTISKREKEIFWFADNFTSPFITIQLGQIGIVCLLTDGGGQRMVMREMYNQIKRKALKSIQFREVATRHLYKEIIRDYIPRFYTLLGEDLPATIVNMTKTIKYKDFNIQDYHVGLKRFTGLNFDETKLKEGDIITIL